MEEKIVSYNVFKNVFNSIEGEPEITFRFKNNQNSYMVIKYNEYITFQKCGMNAKEVIYNSLDELYESTLTDDICLKTDWDNIEDIIIDEGLSFKDDLDYIEEVYLDKK